jgi:hypothetical protein
MTPPDATIVIFPDHVPEAILCIVLALVVLAILCAWINAEKGPKR